jgi:hypothetical protein
MQQPQQPQPLLLSLTFGDVDVYEARSSYWPGRILDGISGGGSLYLTDRADRPWSLTIECGPDAPLAVCFANGKRWSFCGINQRLRDYEWPLFLKDYAADKTKPRVRVERIFSDSFSMDLVSENAVLHDLLVWHHHHTPPKEANAQ